MQIPERDLDRTLASSVRNYREFMNEYETLKVVIWDDGTVEYSERMGLILETGRTWWSPTRTLWEQKP